MSDPMRIGGTRAASILGVGFQSPLEVWAEMTGKIEREDIGHLEHIQAGIFLEPAAKAWFTKRTGLPLLGSPGLVVDAVKPWAAGTPDDIALLPDGSKAVVECKAVHGMSAKAWRTNEDLDAPAEIPLGYRVQGQWYARITGIELVYYAAIVGGGRLETPSMRRDDEFVLAAMEEVERFLVEHVQRDIPPPVSGRDLGVLKRLWPKDTGETRTANLHAPESLALKELIRVKAEIKALEASQKEAQAIICNAMNTAQRLVTPYGEATWKDHDEHHRAKAARVIHKRPLLTKELE